ncbi:hypothetical protein BC567DRAFT_13712 [Phyllosticta citribraziliensis]
MPPLPLHLNTPSASQLRHDLVPAAVGASIGLFAILVGFVVFIVFWARGAPRLRTRGLLPGQQRRTGSKRLRKRKGDGLEKIVEEGEGEGVEVGTDSGVSGVGMRGGGRLGRRQDDATARMSEGETVTVTDTNGVESGDGWEVVRSSSAAQEVVEAVGKKGEARAWWKGGRRGRGWWR